MPDRRLGAAMLAAKDAGDDCRFAMEHLQYGPEYDDAAIEAVLQRNRLSYRRCADIADETAALVADGKGGRLVPGPDGSRTARARRTFDHCRSRARRR